MNNDEYYSRENELDIPVYKIFDPSTKLPNENCRKLFQPSNLKPVLWYY